MNSCMRSLRLYLSARTYVVTVPIIALSAVTAICVFIALVMGIVIGLPLPPEAEEGFRGNVNALTMLVGFLISIGVIAVNRNFAMALALGSTRRHFWAGTALGFVATSLVTAAAAVVLLALEVATHGWFIRAHAFDVVALGNGNYLKAFAMMFILCLFSLFLGALFGTVYRAFGAAPTVVTGVVMGIVVMGLIAIGTWQREKLFSCLADLGLWAVIVIGAALTAAVAAASYSASRLATY